MLAVKKIGGISTIKRKGLKSAKWAENRRGPLPSISQHVIDAKSAPAFREGIHRHRLPMSKVKITQAQTGAGQAATPRIRARLSTRCSIGCALPLGFRGKRLPCPTRIGACFGLAHIHGPVEHSRHFIECQVGEHGARQPSRAFSPPECRMRNSLGSLPIPVFIGPKSTIFIATGGDELEKLAISHFVLIDGKRRNLNFMGFKFVVPAERTAGQRKTEGSG